MGFMNGNMPRALGTAALSVGLLTVSGCEEDGLAGNLAEQCGLNCDTDFVDANGNLTGQANITGFANVDGFFEAVIDFVRVGRNVNGEITAQLNGLKTDFGIEADADFAAEFQAKADTYLEGDIEVTLQEPVCRVDAQATLDASAKCDASIDPGSATVQCQGSCEVEATAEASCSAMAELKCTYESPTFACTGSCEGSCTVDAPSADCNGSCSGSCMGSCTLELRAGGSCDGECSGTCDGSSVDGAACDGTCKGECELTGEAAASCTGTCNGGCEGSCTFDPGGAECMGSCNGSCEMTPPEGSCEGAVEAKCEAMADASVECQGSCEGNVEPPSVSAECEAQVEAKASLEVDCQPPSIRIDYRLAAGVDLDADAEAQAFVEGLAKLRARLPKLRAAFARADRLGPAAGNLAAAGRGAVRGAIDAAVDGDASFAAKAKLRCALVEKDGMTPIAVAANQLESTSQELSMNAVDTKNAFAAFGVSL